jgi:YidC/Oxa1 family membrane protein insertase
MPFFFALYSVLPFMVELQNANFLWIKDLSSPDTVAYINLPMLPNTVNILPILLTIFSFVQTRWFSGGAPATGQAKMMNYLMPIMFLFIFWGMPSGLVLYWLMQTLLSIVQQVYINNRPSKKEKAEDHKVMDHKKKGRLAVK